jgi:hypothetical protein
MQEESSLVSPFSFLRRDDHNDRSHPAISFSTA